MTTIGKRTALGKGLTALLENSNTDPTGRNPMPVNSISEIPVNEIEANPFQPRGAFDEEALQELTDSIKVHGLIQPITVRKVGYGKYQLISGERRLRASIRAGLKKLPAYMRIANDQEMLEMALIENIQRQELNALEVAMSFQRLLEECSLKQDELAERVGKKRSTVANYMRLLKLPHELQAALRDDKISMGHARALINVDDPALQLEFLNEIVDKGLSVRAAEQLVQKSREAAPAAASQPATQRKLQDKDDFQLWRYEIWERRLGKGLDRKVKIKAQKGEKGEILIPFTSEEDLQKITDMLGN
ncbi:MAG: ParB/RepB/Spo0J family partition protein [Bacteroidia bacterium]